MSNKADKFSQSENDYNKTEHLTELLRVKDELLKEREAHLKDIKCHYLFLKVLVMCKDEISAGEALKEYAPIICN